MNRPAVSGPLQALPESISCIVSIAFTAFKAALESNLSRSRRFPVEKPGVEPDADSLIDPDRHHALPHHGFVTRG